MREKNTYTSTSKIVTPFKRPKKKLVRDEEKQLQDNSLRSYFINTGGGDDCA